MILRIHAVIHEKPNPCRRLVTLFQVGLEQKAKEFVEKSAEVYAKT
jgi:hypothetical protein